MHNSFQDFQSKLIICQQLDETSEPEPISHPALAAYIFYGDLSQNWLKDCIARLKQQNITVIVQASPNIAIDLGAQGIHIESEFHHIKEIKSSYPNLIIGAGGMHSKHQAMQLGELGLDYLFFGKLGQPSYNNTLPDLCLWWSELMQIPAIWVARENSIFDKNTHIRPEFVAIDHILIKSFAKNTMISYINNKLKLG